MSLTELFLGGNNDVLYKLFPPRESLVSDILAGDGNIEFFYGVARLTKFFPWQFSYLIQYYLLHNMSLYLYIFACLYPHALPVPGVNI
jgi:hypothetical protein